MSTVVEVAAARLTPEQLARAIRRARVLHSLSRRWAGRRLVRDLIAQRRAGGLG